MRTSIAIVTFVCFLNQAYTQNTFVETIILRHIENTTNNNKWQNLESIYKESTTISADSVVTRRTVLAKWPDRLKIESIKPSSHLVIYENGNDVTVVDNGKVSGFSYGGNFLGMPTESKRNIYAAFNYSFALSHFDSEDIVCKYIGDTTISSKPLHIISIQEPGIQKKNVYVDVITYRIIYVRSMDKRYDLLSYFEDYRWVEGFLFPFKVTTYKYGRMEYVETIDRLSVNSLKDSDFVPD